MQPWLVLLLSVGLAHAGQTYLLAVGIEKYDDPDISAVRYAAADATAVAAAFAAAGVPPGNLFVLTSEAADATSRPTRGQLLGALESIRGRAGADDRLVLFFAGHGLEITGRQYLLTIDARRRYVEDTALSVELLQRVLNDVAPAEQVLLIDACRNDPSAGRGDSDAALTDGLARGLRPRLAQPAAGGRRRVAATLLACDVGQRAWGDPITGHGVFTAQLLDSLRSTPGADGTVRIRALAGQVGQGVAAWCGRNGRKQTPRLVIEEGDDPVVLIAGSQPVTPARVRTGKLAEIRQGTVIEQFTSDPAYVTLWIRCQRRDIPTPQMELLQRWVRAGHRVVVQNDVAEAFGFIGVRTYNSYRSSLWSLAVKPDSHALIRGVQTIDARYAWQRGSYVTTGHPTGVALLVDRETGQYSCLAVAALDQGEAVFRGDYDLADGYDRAAFESNCENYLKTAVAVTPSARPSPVVEQPVVAAPTGQPGKVAEILQPAAVLQFVGDAQYATLCIRAELKMFTSQQAEALKAWVAAGHRVVLQNDVATLFEFSGLATYRDENLFVVAVKPDTHALIRNVRTVDARYDWNKGSSVVTGHRRGVALLVDRATGKNALLAIAPYGRGEAIFLGAYAIAEGYDQAAFEQNLAKYLTQPVPDWVEN